MRKTVKKNKIIPAVYLLLIVFLTQAQTQTNKGFSLTVEPVFQYRKSTIGEYVFFEEESEVKLLSDLQWSLDRILLAGFSLAYEKNRFTSSCTALFGFPGSAGTMTDSDFYTSSPEPTLFSSHEAVITSLLDVFISTGYTIVQDEKVAINCFAAAHYNETGASSYDGYLINRLYTVPVVQNFTGQIISYTQYLLFAWIGSEWRIQPAEPFVVTLSMAYSPFCYAKGWDIHHLRKVEFLDSMKSFYSFKGGVKAALFFTKALSMNIGVEGIFLPLIKGVTGTKQEGGNAFFEQTGYLGGTSLSEARFTASVSYKFSR